MGLEVEAEAGGVAALELSDGEGRAGGVVEGFDVGPFEAGQVEGEAGGAAADEEGDEALAEVAKVETGGGMAGEIGEGKGVKGAIAEDGAEAGKIVRRNNRGCGTSIVDYKFRGGRRRGGGGRA